MKTIIEQWMLTAQVQDYEVSNLGNVRFVNNQNHNLLTYTAIDNDLLVELGSFSYFVSDLVRAAFMPEQEGKLIFIDQNKSNCAVTNLYFQPAKRHLTKIFKDSVLALSMLDIPAETIAKQLGTTKYYVSRILKDNKINCKPNKFDKNYAKFKANLVINNNNDYVEALLAQSKLQMQSTIVCNELNNAVLKHLSELIFNYELIYKSATYICHSEL